MISHRASIKQITLILFSLGLLLRIIAIPMSSHSDVAGYVKWGKTTYENGLAQSFQGAYFPVQYLIFSGAYALSTHIPMETQSIIKIFNLIAELGLLVLLVWLTKKYLETWKLMLIFWLNPLNLIFFDQGYADPQMTFFIVLAVFVIIRGISRYPYLLAGVPLGIAFLMKPQASPIFIGFMILTCLFLVKKEWANLKILGIFAFPLMLFVSFSLYFGFNLELKGHNTLPVISNTLQEKIGLSEGLSDFVAKSSWLGANYAFVPNVMPAINAYMPNAWFFVAEPMRIEGTNIYRVKDTEKFIGLTYRTWGLLLFLIILTTLILKILRSNQELKWKVVFMMLIIPVLVPYIVTGAHENHFFYGFTTLILLGAFMSDKVLLYSAYLLGLLNGINILCLFVLPYYLGIDLNIFYSTYARVSIIGASSLIFFTILYHLIFRVRISDKIGDNGIAI